MASGNLLYDGGSSNLVLCDNIKEWDGVGNEREIQERGGGAVERGDRE